MAAKSYLAPEYAQLSTAMEGKFGLPKGLLHAIVTKGERSNADQVSEAGAKTVFQIIPATRKAALEKYGIDAYLSAENAAEVAARLLKDSLDRNKGDVKAAVSEYHGGTDRSNWGPRTKAYAGRVASTFDRVKAQRAEAEAPAAPSIAKVYEAYKAGVMSPAEKAEFEADVNSGAILLPRGATVAAKPAAHVLPAGVVEAYNSQSEMSDAERAQIDQDVAAGLVAPPKGAALKRPAARSAGEMLGMGTRNVMEGAGGLADIVAGPMGAVMDAVIPGDAIAPDPARTIMKGLADAAGLAEPGTKQEKLAGAAIEGGTQGVLSAGLGVAGAGLKGTTGVVARELAANPVTDIVGSAAAGGASEKARQEGVGPIGQLAVAFGAGVPAAMGTKRLAQVAERFGPKAAKVVETTPREVMLDEKGALTEEGREVAARNDLKADDVKAAYAEAEKPEPAARTVRTHEGTDYPVQVIDETPIDHQGQPHIKVRGEDGAEGYVPAAEVRQIEEAAPAAREAPEPAAAATPAAETPLPATAAARYDEAASEGVILSKGQATKDFEAQSAEQDLAGTQSPEGQRARDHFAAQAEQIKGAVDRFKSALGPEATAEERGQLIKDAVRELRDSGKAGVTALYEQARDLATKMGEGADNLIHLDTAPILQKMRELQVDRVVPAPVREALRDEMARYGLIGQPAKTVEGISSVRLLDDEGKVAETIRFHGPQERLTILNAEDLRKTVNDLFRQDTSGRSQALKPLIDDAVDAAVRRAAKEGTGDVGAAFQAARAGHVVQKKTFAAKDVVQKIIDWKKGAPGTEALNPEQVIKTVFGSGPEAITSLKKVKAVLLNKPTDASRAAWSAIQAHGVADIFNKATVVNANLGGELGAISGAKLNSEIARFGADKLRVLLSEEDFNQLMKLRRVISDATIPLKGTTNPSGSGHLLTRFFAKQAQNLSPVAKLVPFVRDVVKGAEEMVATSQTKKVVEDVTSFTPEKAANADAPKPKADPMAFVRRYLKVAGSDEIIAPVMAAAANEDRP